MENKYKEQIKSSVAFGLSIEENYNKRVWYEMVKNKSNGNGTNLDEITIDDLDSFWSSGCSGR